MNWPIVKSSWDNPTLQPVQIRREATRRTRNADRARSGKAHNGALSFETAEFKLLFETLTQAALKLY
jgi:hypothetical protein